MFDLVHGIFFVYVYKTCGTLNSAVYVISVSQALITTALKTARSGRSVMLGFRVRFFPWLLMQVALNKPD